MAWTTADRDALKAAIASGERRVRYGDREVEYRTLEEMNGILGQMDADINGAVPQESRRPKQWGGYVTTKGF
jgi:hypothetical protein